MTRGRDEGDGREGDVAVEGERHGVHELGRVRHERKEGDAEELLVDARAFKNDVHDRDEDLCARRRSLRSASSADARKGKMKRDGRRDEPAMTA